MDQPREQEPEMPSASDPCGQTITTATATGARAVQDFVDGFLAYDARLLAISAEAERDDSLIVQTLAAVLHLFGEDAAGQVYARRHLARGLARAGLASERERSLARAVHHWAEGDLPAALQAHRQHQQQWPRDLLAMKLGQYLHFNAGDSPGMLRLALAARDAAADVPALHGMLAFGYEQCHRLAEAEASARHALALQPQDPWAQHALAHVMLTQGRYDEGRRFLEGACAGWRGLTSFMRTHNWWHLALFLIETGEPEAALRLYDEQVWGVDRTYSQDQIGAVSLLARLELVGVDVGERWDELAPWLARHARDHVLPFLDLQYLYGLARAAHPAAEDLQAGLRQRAQRATPDARAVWFEVAVPAAAGLVSHAHGEWHRAASALAQALPRLTRLGGSHAQRDLFEQIFVDALVRSGQAGAAQNLLQPQLNATPASWRLRRQLEPVDAALGLPPAERSH